MEEKKISQERLKDIVNNGKHITGMINELQTRLPQWIADMSELRDAGILSESIKDTAFQAIHGTKFDNSFFDKSRIVLSSIKEQYERDKKE